MSPALEATSKYCKFEHRHHHQGSNKEHFACFFLKCVSLCSKTLQRHQRPLPVLHLYRNVALFPVASENKSDLLGSNAGQMHLLHSLIRSFGQSQRTIFSCQGMFWFLCCLRAKERKLTTFQWRKENVPNKTPKQ